MLRRCLRPSPWRARTSSQHILLRRSTNSRIATERKAVLNPKLIVAEVTLLTAGAVTYSIYLKNDSRYMLHNDSPSEVINDSWGAKLEHELPPQALPIESKESAVTSVVNILPDWSSIGDRIIDATIPGWAQSLPGFVRKLQQELSMEPGTLAYEIWQDAHDPEINPEIMWDASVRVSQDLCADEKLFLQKRKRHLGKALAFYLDVPEEQVHPDDMPTIAMCGSGGGLRALVAGAASYLSAQEAGLFDCVTYTAGVSGSCWLQALYYSTITGQSHDRLIEHLKNRIGVHICYPPPVIELITSAPTAKFLLSGGLEKYRGTNDADFGIVDIYGLLLGARLLVPKGDLGVNDLNLKVSNQRRYIDNGEHPLPIYTAVRHEIPIEEAENAESVKDQARKEAWFQWFEFTPYEFWCEELDAGIPTWSMGRQFRNGRNLWRENGLALPEIRVPLLMGIWGSAFCATLAHYFKEIRPLLKGYSGFVWLDPFIAGRNEDLVKVHPINPACVPNYVMGMRDKLPKSCPESIHTNPQIQLMDAGMSNNLPIYPLLRPGRDVDIIIAFDASADIQKENWLRVTDGYARQRGIRGWPVGTGWPDEEDAGQRKLSQELDAADTATASEVHEKMSQAERDQEATRMRTKNQNSAKTLISEQKKAEGDASDATPKASQKQGKNQNYTDLDHCNVWVGTTEERINVSKPPPSKRVEGEWDLMVPDAGIAVIYFPFTANAKVEGVDPATSEFMSTWNSVYTPEEIDKVVRLARANFEEGKEMTRMCVKTVYERKKKHRLERERAEEEARERRWRFGSEGERRQRNSAAHLA